MATAGHGLKGHAPGGAIVLILAFPVLVAISVVLNTAGSTKQVLLPVGLLAWFVGPVLFAMGVAMLLWRAGWTVSPVTVPGRWSLKLLVGFVASMVVFFLALGVQLGPDDPETFFSNLFLALPLLLAGALAVAAAAAGVYAMIIHKERSFLVIGAVTFGVLVAIFAVGEVAGHEEPSGQNGRSGDSPNSHSNISVAAPGPRTVQVGFDYTYGSDPPGERITAITVTALGQDTEPLTGYEPQVLPVGRGSGRLSVSFDFSEEQIAQLTGFSICFTGDGESDLGCTVGLYPAR